MMNGEEVLKRIKKKLPGRLRMSGSFDGVFLEKFFL